MAAFAPAARCLQSGSPLGGGDGARSRNVERVLQLVQVLVGARLGAQKTARLTQQPEPARLPVRSGGRSRSSDPGFPAVQVQQVQLISVWCEAKNVARVFEHLEIIVRPVRGCAVVRFVRRLREGPTSLQ